jgi:hypothetical protein
MYPAHRLAACFWRAGRSLLALALAGNADRA